MYFSEADKRQMLRAIATGGTPDEAAAIREIWPIYQDLIAETPHREALQMAIELFFEAGKIYGQK